MTLPIYVNVPRWIPFFVLNVLHKAQGKILWIFITILDYLHVHLKSPATTHHIRQHKQGCWGNNRGMHLSNASSWTTNSPVNRNSALPYVIRVPTKAPLLLVNLLD